MEQVTDVNPSIGNVEVIRPGPRIVKAKNNEEVQADLREASQTNQSTSQTQYESAGNMKREFTINDSVLPVIKGNVLCRCWAMAVQNYTNIANLYTGKIHAELQWKNILR